MQTAIIDFSRLTSAGPVPTLTEEQSIARDTPGNVLCIAVPGAGKTEVCTQRGEQNEAKGLRTLSIQHTRAGRDEYKLRVPNAEVFTIHQYCKNSVGWKHDYADLLYRFVISENKEVFDEVILDEVQDVSPLQLDVIYSIPKKTLFAVGDPHQSIYTGDWAKTYFDSPAMGERIFDKLAKVCTVREIHGNRRSTQHIVSILEKIRPREMEPRGPKLLDTTAILARRHRDLKEVRNFLESYSIPYTIRVPSDEEEPQYITFGTNPKLHLMVMHQCKGKQFKEVYILDWQGYSQEDYNLLYTSVARAAEEVYIVGQKGIGGILPPELRISSTKVMVDWIESRR